MPSTPAYDPATVVQDTVRWLERAVIDLNLCPFAKGVHSKGQIHYVVSSASDTDALALDVERELQALADISPEKRDTTLLMAPACLHDFYDFNDFVNVAERLLEALGLDGTLQIASFHPQFQFADTEPDDISNYTNRSPYPTLHLIREESIAKAAEAIPDAAEIFERNIRLLEEMGHEGWQKLGLPQTEKE